MRMKLQLTTSQLNMLLIAQADNTLWKQRYCCRQATPHEMCSYGQRRTSLLLLNYSVHLLGGWIFLLVALTYFFHAYCKESSTTVQLCLVIITCIKRNVLICFPVCCKDQGVTSRAMDVSLCSWDNATPWSVYVIMYMWLIATFNMGTCVSFLYVHNLSKKYWYFRMEGVLFIN